MALLRQPILFLARSDRVKRLVSTLPVSSGIVTMIAEPQLLSPPEFRQMVSDEVRTWRGVAQTAGIRVQ